MGKIIRNGVIYTGSSDEADKIHYKNSNSDLDSTTVQGALDELANEMLPKTGGVLDGELDVPNVVNFRNKGYVGSFGNEAVLISKSSSNPNNGRYLTVANQDTEPDFKNGLSIVEITGDNYNVKRVYTEANPPSAAVVGAVQRGIWTWYSTSGSKLCTKIIEYLNEGFTCGVIQLDCKTYGRPSDIPSDIGDYFICKFQKHGYDFFDAELIPDNGVQFFYNTCVIANGVFTNTSWRRMITNIDASFSESILVTKSSYPNLVLRNGTTGPHSKFEFNNGDLGIYSFDDQGIGYRGVVVKNENMMSDIRHALNFDSKKADGTFESYDVFGEHNKPTGSYTGTGTTAARVINTGGIGRIVVITSTKGTAILTTTGGMTFNSLGVNGVIDTEVKFDSTTGDIKLWTTNMFFNEAGLVYTYQVL